MPRGGGFGRGFGMRRPGIGLFPVGGFGFGMGSPLLTGVLGYLLGSRVGSQQEEPQNNEPESEKKSDNTDEKLSKLKLLADLHDRGVLTDEEFLEEKDKILNN